MTKFTSTLLLSASFLSLPVMAMKSSTAIGGPSGEDADQLLVVAGGAAARLDFTKEDAQPREGLYTTRGVFPYWDGHRTTSRVITIPPNTTDEELLRGIRHYKHLRVLDLSNAPHLTADGIIQAIRGSNVTTLTLNSEMSPEDVVRLVVACPGVDTLTPPKDVTEEMINAAQAELIASGMGGDERVLAILREYYFNYQAEIRYTVEDFAARLASLPSFVSGIQISKLNTDNIQNDIQNVMAALGAHHKAHPDRIVTTLNLSGNSIGNGGARALAAALVSVPHLRSLSLYDSNIGDDGARALAAALALVPQLRSLNLGFNNIGDAGARALAAALVSVPHLRSLSLKAADIGVDGTRALAAALVSIPQLTTLYLEFAAIGGIDGARALAAALVSIPHLRSLSLSRRLIGSEGRAAIRAAIDAINADRAIAGLPVIQLHL